MLFIRQARLLLPGLPYLLGGISDADSGSEYQIGFVAE